MDTKRPDNFPALDGNWQWPQKTWFRKRLNAIKAQKTGQRCNLGGRAIPLIGAAPAIDGKPDSLKLERS